MCVELKPIHVCHLDRMHVRHPFTIPRQPSMQHAINIKPILTILYISIKNINKKIKVIFFNYLQMETFSNL